MALILTFITINNSDDPTDDSKEIYLTTNGVHLDIIIPKEYLRKDLLEDLSYTDDETYFAFGWGDENFYLNTPTWGDLTFSNAFQAMFLKSTTLIHLTKYKTKRAGWITVKTDDTRLDKLNQYILNSFKITDDRRKILLPDKGYTFHDDFYSANGSYSCFKTCNTWANSAFKESGLKSCYWTPFDFGLLGKYE